MLYPIRSNKTPFLLNGKHHSIILSFKHCSIIHHTIYKLYYRTLTIEKKYSRVFGSPVLLANSSLTAPGDSVNAFYVKGRILCFIKTTVV